MYQSVLNQKKNIFLSAFRSYMDAALLPEKALVFYITAWLPVLLSYYSYRKRPKQYF